MHQIGVVGLSYRHAGVDEVARFAVPRAEVPARLPLLRGLLKASEILYVGTCNRVEVLYSTEDGSPAGDSRQEVFRILTGREPAPGEAARILRAWTGEAAVEHLFLVACGLDPARCTLFVQSDVREHTELAWYLANVTPFGDLERMTQFKDKRAKEEHVLAGFFQYPVLMSADILLYKATIVPVGEDQLQHLELARETARRFNYRFGETFPEPQPRMSAAPRSRCRAGRRSRRTASFCCCSC